MAGLKYTGELSKGELWSRNRSLRQIIREKDLEIAGLKKELEAEQQRRYELNVELFEHELTTEENNG